MNILNSLIKYFCLNYPHSSELSNARLTKMIYLADWYSVSSTGNQITNIKWYFDNYGPFVPDVYNEANSDKSIEVINTSTPYGTPKTLFKYNGENPILSNEIKIILDKVIDDTKSLYWNDFISFIYNTNPIKDSNRYSYLDLGNFIKNSEI